MLPYALQEQDRQRTGAGRVAHVLGLFSRPGIHFPAAQKSTKIANPPTVQNLIEPLHLGLGTSMFGQLRKVHLVCLSCFTAVARQIRVNDSPLVDAGTPRQEGQTP